MDGEDRRTDMSKLSEKDRWILRAEYARIIQIHVQNLADSVDDVDLERILIYTECLRKNLREFEEHL